ncbi:tail assembly chaperone [Candidatus Enterococcus clewellii]|uniref:Phage protein n=1 Tax=Candidatus Enterococcus clewellii TaxID=1834193 RepID=A0A242K3R4_9ENTE|nr:tail assembly chaperone [Enterococcus sp. 9E7_DIV0242]OTP13440.1 hypothetical protein A5888_002918 [Enterococcus sp. 9E7_DIV0242]
MTFSINIKSKPLEIKFNYSLFFRANKKLGTKDEKGNSMNNGAGILFSKMLEQDDEAVIDIIKLAAKDKYSENDIFEAIENYSDEHGVGDEAAGYDMLFEEMKQEMLVSGFFKKKILKYIEQMEKAAEVLSKKEDAESKTQAEAVKELIEKMKKELS